MTPGSYSFSIRRSVTWEGLRLELLDSERVAINLTGYTAHAQMRRKAGTEVILEFTATVSTEDAGVVDLAQLTDEQTAALPLGRFAWDLVLKKDGVVHGPYLAGTVTVEDVITIAD